MKAYRVEQLGFVLDIPEKWTLPAFGATQTPLGESLVFGCEYFEAFKLSIRKTVPEPSPEQTEDEFRRTAESSHFSSLEFGRMVVAGKEQPWARYYLGSGRWSKRYWVNMRGVEYAFTATCNFQNMLLEREQVWDAVVTSFHSLTHPDPKSADNDQAVQPNQQATKTYRNEKHGFEMDLPAAWAPAPAIANRIADILTGPVPKGAEKDCFQYGCYDEAFNFQIGRLFPEPLLEDTESEFRLYAQITGFKEVVFGRITVGGKEHVCAHYSVADKMGKRWNKKYMLVFGGIEYAITGTCNDPQYFARRDKDWDAIIRTFHLLGPVDESANSHPKVDRLRDKRREMVDQRIEMREVTGNLYATGYEAVTLGQYAKARGLLQECLRENPEHVLAHKELAVVLKKVGDPKGALQHRKEVKRLAPDDLINRANLVELLAASGKSGEALREIKEVLTMVPNQPTFRDLEDKVRRFRYVDYRMMFFAGLICLLLTIISLWSGQAAARDLWILRLMMLMPAGCLVISGPWVGLSRILSGLLGVVLYLLFLIPTF